MRGHIRLRISVKISEKRIPRFWVIVWVSLSIVEYFSSLIQENTISQKLAPTFQINSLISHIGGEKKREYNPFLTQIINTNYCQYEGDSFFHTQILFIKNNWEHYRDKYRISHDLCDYSNRSIIIVCKEVCDGGNIYTYGKEHRYIEWYPSKIPWRKWEELFSIENKW